MARIRSIKPEISSDVKLAKLPADVRWTFVLCISQADDCGLLPGTARALLGTLYPNTRNVSEAKLSRWLHQLHDAGMLESLISLDGAPLYHLTKWDDHQKVEKPHLSALSRSLLDGPIGNNSMMTKEQRELVLRTIRERVANTSPKDYPTPSPNDSGKRSPNTSPKDSRQDLRPWTLDQGSTESVCVEVLQQTSAALAGALAMPNSTHAPTLTVENGRAA